MAGKKGTRRPGRRKSSDDTNKVPFHVRVAEATLTSLKEGFAPWTKPWRPGNPNRLVPFNRERKNFYRGVNLLVLLYEAQEKGYRSNEWMTLRQANKLGYFIKRGERPTPVQYWKFDEWVPKTDPETGAQMKDDKGKVIKVKRRLKKPKPFFANVYNTDQIDGLEPLPSQPPEPNWEVTEQGREALEIIEKLPELLGVKLAHDQHDRAFYRVSEDGIHMPDKTQFPDARSYALVLAHEVGHATGHQDRMGRDLSGKFGSPEYACEELRAEILSMMLGDYLGIGHEPERHAGYIGSWIEKIENDHFEIFRASSDAQHAFDLIRNRLMEAGLEPSHTASAFGEDAEDEQREQDESAVEKDEALEMDDLPEDPFKAVEADPDFF